MKLETQVFELKTRTKQLQDSWIFMKTECFVYSVKLYKLEKTIPQLKTN